MIFHWSFSDNTSPLVSRTISSILTGLNAVVWMVFTHPPVSKSPRPLNKTSEIVSSAPIIIAISVTFILFCFLYSIIIIFLRVFPPSITDVFSLEFKWQQFLQVSRIFRRILGHINIAAVWMVSSCPLISKFSSSFTNPFGSRVS